MQYIPYLEAEGLNIVAQPIFDDEHLENIYETGERSLLKTMLRYIKRALVLFQLPVFDLIWLEKEVFPYLPAVVERMLSFINKPYVVGYDDAIFHNYDISSNPITRWLLV